MVDKLICSTVTTSTTPPPSLPPINPTEKQHNKQTKDKNNHLISFHFRRSFKAHDLYADEFAQQSLLILAKTRQTPICIDPHSIAFDFIKMTHGCQNNIELLRFNMTDIILKLEKAIAFGKTVIFDDIDEYIDPIFMDLLEKKLISWFLPHLSPLCFAFTSFCLF